MRRQYATCGIGIFKFLHQNYQSVFVKPQLHFQPVEVLPILLKKNPHAFLLSRLCIESGKEDGDEMMLFLAVSPV